MYQYNAQLVLKTHDIYDCIIIKSNTKLNIKCCSSFNVCDSLKLTKRGKLYTNALSKSFIFYRTLRPT